MNALIRIAKILQDKNQAGYRFNGFKLRVFRSSFRFEWVRLKISTFNVPSLSILILSLVISQSFSVIPVVKKCFGVVLLAACSST